MSPVFRHGRLRLYLLKLLDEAPRHGYEVIRLLQDRFMGVYAPSPGTIYPRLARLEEEGLVTHDEVDGRKVYRITEQGREELRNRSGDLFELEEEITASVRDIAREVTEDVRETMRNLRRELSVAARDVQRGSAAGRPAASGAAASQPAPWGSTDGGPTAGGTTASGTTAGGTTAGVPTAGGPTAGDSAMGEPPGDHRASAERERLQAEWQRLEAERDRLESERERLEAERERLEAEEERLEREAAQAPGERPGEGTGGERPGEGTGGERPGEGARGWGAGGWGPAGWGAADWSAAGWSPRDLEGLARQFSTELRSAAAHAQEASEQAATELRVILDDALDRIRAEVFRTGRDERGGEPGGPGGKHPREK